MKPILLAIAAASILILPARDFHKDAKNPVRKHTNRVHVPLPAKTNVPDSVTNTIDSANNEHFLHDVFVFTKF